MTEASLASLSHDLARAFRPVLNAMANPGRIFPFGPALAPASGLTLEAAAVAIALCDFQTPIWLAQDLRSPATEHYLRFHTGAPLTLGRRKYPVQDPAHAGDAAVGRQQPDARQADERASGQC